MAVEMEKVHTHSVIRLALQDYILKLLTSGALQSAREAYRIYAIDFGGYPEVFSPAELNQLRED